MYFVHKILSTLRKFSRVGSETRTLAPVPPGTMRSRSTLMANRDLQLRRAHEAPPGDRDLLMISSRAPGALRVRRCAECDSAVKRRGNAARCRIYVGIGRKLEARAGSGRFFGN